MLLRQTQEKKTIAINSKIIMTFKTTLSRVYRKMESDLHPFRQAHEDQWKEAGKSPPIEHLPGYCKKSPLIQKEVFYFFKQLHSDKFTFTKETV